MLKSAHGRDMNTKHAAKRVKKNTRSSRDCSQQLKIQLWRNCFIFISFYGRDFFLLPSNAQLFLFRIVCWKSSRPVAVAVAYMSIEVYLYSVCVRHIVSAFIVYFCHMERNEYNCMIAIEELRPRK